MKALVVVDMLNDFILDTGALPVPAARIIIPTIEKLLSYARQKGWLIIYLADNHAENDKEFEIWGRHSIKGTPGSEVIRELEPNPGDILIPKTRYSGFYNTNMDAILKQHDVDSLVITGTLTDICVLYTTADARNRDMTVVIVSDGTATLNSQRQLWALQHAKSVLNAQIKTCAEVLASN